MKFYSHLGSVEVKVYVKLQGTRKSLNTNLADAKLNEILQ